MVVLGIDPGYAIVGYGVLERKPQRPGVLDYGVLQTPKERSLPDRLEMIAEGIDALIARHKPDAVAVEELFFARNVTTALSVAHARGVILLSAKRSGVALFEYTPMQIKQALTGYGKADKQQMQGMVQTLLGLASRPRPDDAADALAVALCHLNTNIFTGGFKI